MLGGDGGGLDGGLDGGVGRSVVVFWQFGGAEDMVKFYAPEIRELLEAFPGWGGL